MGMAHVCDFPQLDPDEKCPGRVVHQARVSFAERELTADYCAKHVADVKEGLALLGLKDTASRHGGRRRALYTAASGQMFNAAQVRAWLRERGDTPVAGRLSGEVIAEYAAVH